MTRDEATERFNALPRETRTTIIANEILQKINLFNSEKIAATAAHNANMRRINDRIKSLEKWLSELKDD